MERINSQWVDPTVNDSTSAPTQPADVPQNLDQPAAATDSTAKPVNPRDDLAVAVYGTGSEYGTLANNWRAVHPAYTYIQTIAYATILVGVRVALHLSTPMDESAILAFASWLETEKLAYKKRKKMSNEVYEAMTRLVVEFQDEAELCAQMSATVTRSWFTGIKTAKIKFSKREDSPEFIFNGYFGTWYSTLYNTKLLVDMLSEE
mmetsp:Transcript_8466/g.9463  ORF Transcript_8466/g.9463 Transcript_8466/m.9463 type:complete len:205 (-) Transcript_8466:418-1032(-)